MKRVVLFCIFVIALLAPGLSHAQQAAAYPQRQVRMVVPYPAGGPHRPHRPDHRAKARRAARQILLCREYRGRERRGRRRPGGAGSSDGYTLLVVTNDFAVASVTNSNLPYDPIKNFTPVTIVASSPQVVAVNPSFPAKTDEGTDRRPARRAGQIQLRFARNWFRPTVRRAAVQAGPQARQTGPACRSTAQRLQSIRRSPATPNSSFLACLRSLRI